MVLVLFEKLKDIETAATSVKEFKKQLGFTEDYELHLSRNSSVTKNAFTGLIANLDFKYIFVCLRKTDDRRAASYKVLVEKLLSQASRVTGRINIKMDDNPTLYAEIRCQSKDFPIKVRCKQVHSKNSELIQLADYVVGLSLKQAKGQQIPAIWPQIAKIKRII